MQVTGPKKYFTSAPKTVATILKAPTRLFFMPVCIDKLKDIPELNRSNDLKIVFCRCDSDTYTYFSLFIKKSFSKNNKIVT